MTTLTEKTETLAVEVSCSMDALSVTLTDGRVVSVPLVWFPRLADASPRDTSQVLQRSLSVRASTDGSFFAGSETASRRRPQTLSASALPFARRQMNVPQSSFIAGPPRHDIGRVLSVRLRSRT